TATGSKALVREEESSRRTPPPQERDRLPRSRGVRTGQAVSGNPQGARNPDGPQGRFGDGQPHRGTKEETRGGPREGRRSGDPPHRHDVSLALLPSGRRN